MQVDLKNIYSADLEVMREVRITELNELKRLLPEALDYLPVNVIKLLLPSVTLSICKIPLAEYTPYASGVLRAAEQILVMILSKYNFVDADGKIIDFQNEEFGKLFLYNKKTHYYYMSRQNIELLGSPKFGRVLCTYYNTFKSYRNRYFHSRCKNCRSIPRIKLIEHASKIIEQMLACINLAVDFVKED